MKAALRSCTLLCVTLSQEYMAGGTLKQLVTREMLGNGRRTYSYKQALDICLQMARGLRWVTTRSLGAPTTAFHKPISSHTTKIIMALLRRNSSLFGIEAGSIRQSIPGCSKLPSLGHDWYCRAAAARAGREATTRHRVECLQFGMWLYTVSAGVLYHRPWNLAASDTYAPD